MCCKTCNKVKYHERRVVSQAVIQGLIAKPDPLSGARIQEPVYLPLSGARTWEPTYQPFDKAGICHVNKTISSFSPHLSTNFSISSLVNLVIITSKQLSFVALCFRYSQCPLPASYHHRTPPIAPSNPPPKPIYRMW